jgi:hypothetical protein
VEEEPKYPFCTFWNLAEKNCEGVRIQVRRDVFAKMIDLHHALGPKVGCLGGVRGLYTPEGGLITDLSELTEGKDVVVAPSGYAFEKSFLPLKLARKLGTS